MMRQSKEFCGSERRGCSCIASVTFKNWLVAGQQLPPAVF